jgi:hypothetical protein
VGRTDKITTSSDVSVAVVCLVLGVATSAVLAYQSWYVRSESYIHGAPWLCRADRSEEDACLNLRPE